MTPERHSDASKIVSPFANTEVAVTQVYEKKSNVLLWVGLGILLLVSGVGVGLAVNNYLSDPYRTLELFPFDKYLQDPNTLYGSRYKATIQVENELYWKENVGRLMLFSSATTSDLVAVMIPSAIAKDLTFDKGQTYTAELEVKEGGLIYANAIRKN